MGAISPRAMSKFSGISKNDRCPCGSGRKFKNCCLSRTSKPRSTSVFATFDKPVSVRAFAISNAREVTLFDEEMNPLHPKDVHVKTHYGRAKGEKILNVAGSIPRSMVAQVEAILPTFDYVFAVDTNTKVIAGRTVSVCMWEFRED